MTRTFAIPYDSGQRAVRMGAGPLRIAETLGITPETIEAPGTWRAEIRTTFDLYGRLAERVRETGDAPVVVLSGNCGAAVGAAAGIGTDDLAVIWFDAHGDYNTPDTTDTGYLDGMAMAVLTGRCWKGIARTIPNFAPVPPSRTMHVGARDFSPGERDALLSDGVALIEPSLSGLESSLDRLRASRVLVHVDLDVIDPSHGRANQYAAPDGLSPADVLRVIALAQQRFTLAALVVASYDPAFDEGGRMATIGADIVRAIAP